ncbi:UDP-N-acetylmuramoyl-L-alanyl-D-glutamate--2,6-diaminopimelate ligase [bioreactor metagenome]|uniref:UDP-N-acetylmuramoyl-L-alanyl-D-glutamate--2, 6-diaminopimelate ligase n=1 Tax=bioreactor metagenome TaxID=1076179 RepID=A0A645BPA9_9ZZZZ
MQIQTILNSFLYTEIVNNQAITISEIAYNSNKCTDNCIFVAIKGTSTDGSIFIDDAISKGAKVIVCENLPATVHNDITYIIVPNSRVALAELAYIFYDYPAKKMKIIGITGTNGKTTTTFLLKSAIETAGKKVAVIGTAGIYINDKKIEATHTTPESLELAQLFKEMNKENIEYVVMEVSSHALAMHRTHGINFTIAAFTNLTHDHLDLHNTLEEYANAKKMLFDGLNNDSIAVVNADDKYAEFMIANSKAKKITISSSNKQSADYFIDNVAIDKHNSKFTILNKNEKYDIETQLTAFFNVQNAALAIAICFELGLDKDLVMKGIHESKGAKGRLELVKIKTGATAFVDYAHTPDALEKVLITCKDLLVEKNSTVEKKASGKLICVFGCGGDRDKTKRAVMGEIAEKYADIVIVTSDNPRTEDPILIIEDILKGIKNKSNVHTINNRSEAIKFAVSISSSKDIVLVDGKGHENYQIIGKEKRFFSDIEELIR